MSEYLHGVHDTDGAHLMDGFPGWVVVTEAIGHDPNNRSGRDYSEWSRRGLGVMVRLNNAHDGVNGTIPEPRDYRDFATRCANFVAASTGITLAIIGNEPNHANEWPRGMPIDPLDYARCYGECRMAIQAALPGLPVLVAAVAPWNGDWLAYLQRVVNQLWTGSDGFALHAYTHGSDPALIFSDEMQHGWYWHFRVYRQQMVAIREIVKGAAAANMLFVITETNQGDGPWLDADSGWVQNAYKEIADWNALQPLMPIRGLTLYRSNRDDRWSFADKEGVKRDFRKAVERGHKAPSLPSATKPPASNTFIPAASTGNLTTTPTPDLPPRDVDPRAEKRGTRIITPSVSPGQSFWRVKRLYTPNEDESDRLGPDHHILANVLVDGQRQVGVSLLVTWGGGGGDERTTIHTKKNDAFAFSADHPLSPGDFTLEVADGRPSEKVVGIKMGAFDAEGRWNPGAHESTLIDYELVTMPAATVPAPTLVDPAPTLVDPAPTPPTPINPSSMPALTQPILDPALRIVSQRFGDNPQDYAKFGLAGHNGVDYAVPVGTHIFAVDAGRVVEVADDPDGYGLYVKIVHDWGESLYAHLDMQFAGIDEVVERGDMIGSSGSTGNSSGPHLHFAMRVNPYTRGYPYDGYSDPLPYLGAASVPPHPTPPVLAAIKAAATEFGLEWQLLASQAWAESSWRPDAVSDAGAKGLLQIMDATWAEWSAKIGAGNDPFDARQNARVGAAYLAWLIKQTKGNIYDALVAYGWGIGNLLSGQSVEPYQWAVYANKVIHGRDLLKAVGA